MKLSRRLRGSCASRNLGVKQDSEYHYNDQFKHKWHTMLQIATIRSTDSFPTMRCVGAFFWEYTSLALGDNRARKS